MIDLKEIFDNAPWYVILRQSKEFPEYTPGQDVDILCDIDKMIEYLQQHFKHKTISALLLKPVQHIEKSYISHQALPADCRIPVTVLTHVHLDHIVGGKIDIRFDLYSEVISKKFTEELRLHDITPGPALDAILKCYEYIYNGKGKYAKYGQYRELLREYEV